MRNNYITVDKTIEIDLSDYDKEIKEYAINKLGFSESINDYDDDELVDELVSRNIFSYDMLEILNKLPKDIVTTNQFEQMLKEFYRNIIS